MGLIEWLLRLIAGKHAPLLTVAELSRCVDVIYIGTVVSIAVFAIFVLAIWAIIRGDPYPPD